MSRWMLLGAIVALFVLVPFVLFEHGLNNWTLQQLRRDAEPVWVAAIVVALLATDVVLPVPSSLVSTAAGASLGFVVGVAASVCGMTVAALGGYVLGRTFGLPVARWLVSGRDLEIASGHVQRRAGAALVVMRGIPVLAEASVLMAGVFQVNRRLFFVTTFLANVGISIAYCGVGALALSLNSFAVAFAGAIAVPAVILRVAGRFERRRIEPLP